jgi:hypothetical protein
LVESSDTKDLELSLLINDLKVLLAQLISFLDSWHWNKDITEDHYYTIPLKALNWNDRYKRKKDKSTLSVFQMYVQILD